MSNVNVDIEGIARLLIKRLRAASCSTCALSISERRSCPESPCNWGINADTAYSIAGRIAALIERDNPTVDQSLGIMIEQNIDTLTGTLVGVRVC
jgi:hypothetical protein